jgi:hypothetical protein
MLSTSSNGELDVTMLMRLYGEENCVGKERGCIVRNADLPASIAEQRREDAALRRLFTDTMALQSHVDNPPSPQNLIAYVDGALADYGRRFIEQYLQLYPYICEEILMLRQLGHNPLMPK